MSVRGGGGGGGRGWGGGTGCVGGCLRCGCKLHPRALGTNFRSLPAYFKALVRRCFSFSGCCRLAPIFCLIVIHVQSVCLANLLLVGATPQPRLSMCHGVFFAIFCIIRLTLVTHSSPAEFLQDVFLEVQDSANEYNKTTIKPSMRSHECTASFTTPTLRFCSADTDNLYACFVEKKKKKKKR